MVVESGQLFVNGKSYGEISVGSMVSITDEGVAVNKEVRGPLELTEATLNLLAPVRDYQTTINGHTIMIRARESSGIESSLLGGGRLVADGRMIALRKGRLRVDGDVVADLKPGDVILVDTAGVDVIRRGGDRERVSTSQRHDSPHIP